MYADSSLGNIDGVYSQSSFLIFLAEPSIQSQCFRVSILDWTSKKIRRVVRSSLAAETVAVNNSVDQALYVSQLLEEFSNRRLNVEILNDNMSLHQLIQTDNSVTEKALLREISALRQWFRSGIGFHHVPTKYCIADTLTKYNSSGTRHLLQSVLDNCKIGADILPQSIVWKYLTRA